MLVQIQTASPQRKRGQILKRYVVEDSDGDEGYVIACNMLHATIRAKDNNCSLTGETESVLDDLDFCEICLAEGKV